MLKSIFKKAGRRGLTVSGKAQGRNAGDEPNSAHIRGEQSEKLVSKYLSELGYYFVASRWKTPYAELDLVFRKGDDFYIVEVKSLGRLDFGPVRVMAGQKGRLLRAREWLESQTGCGVALAFAYVLPDKEILLLNADGEALT